MIAAMVPRVEIAPGVLMPMLGCVVLEAPSIQMRSARRLALIAHPAHSVTGRGLPHAPPLVAGSLIPHSPHIATGGKPLIVVLISSLVVMVESSILLGKIKVGPPPKPRCAARRRAARPRCTRGRTRRQAQADDDRARVWRLDGGAHGALPRAPARAAGSL